MTAVDHPPFWASRRREPCECDDSIHVEAKMSLKLSPAALVQSLHPMRRLLAVRRELTRTIRRVTLAGSALQCPLCEGEARRFVGPYADTCPWCDSNGRHRFLWWYLSPRLRPGSRVLHLAPEQSVRRRLASAPITYVTADLNRPDVTFRVDLSDEEAVSRTLGRSYDFVLCSHILEHIPDDLAAMRSLCRSLAPGGQALIQVPLDPARPTTYEDWSITQPAARLAAFGQEDHVRVYGRDFVGRLERVGFHVTVLPPPAELVTLCCLNGDDPIYLCEARAN